MRCICEPAKNWEVVVVTDRAPAYSSLTPANVQVISARDLTKSACCNLAESFETNASVEVTTSDAVALTTGPRTYDGTQCTSIATLLFQSVLGNTAHGYCTGLSFLYDDYREIFRDGHRYSSETAADVYTREHHNRRELVPGAFAEYTYQNSCNLTVVAGLRADHHNLYGWHATPQLNIKYDAAKNTVLRLAVDRAFA